MQGFQGIFCYIYRGKSYRPSIFNRTIVSLIYKTQDMYRTMGIILVTFYLQHSCDQRSLYFRIVLLSSSVLGMADEEKAIDSDAQSEGMFIL